MTLAALAIKELQTSSNIFVKKETLNPLEKTKKEEVLMIVDMQEFFLDVSLLRTSQSLFILKEKIKNVID
jgi:hypothetical protein